jgi:uncharacterized protein
MSEAALITGATSGIGLSLSYLLAKRYKTLILTGRNEEQLKELSEKLPCSVISCAADLTSPEERKKVIVLIEKVQPTLIINNAGFGLYGDTLMHETKEQLDMIEVNCKALVEITLESARTLALYKKKGTILNIASAAAFFRYPSFNLYAATKAFVLHFSETLDVELSPMGIRVLTACPGMIATDFRRRASKGASVKNAYSMSSERAAHLLLKQIEMGKRRFVFGRSTAILIFLSKLFPEKIVQRFLKKSIETRVK